MAKIERTKNAARNFFFGTILKLYQILIPFVIRTVMIYCMGVKYLGMNSLFSSILQVLNLAELGVGSAMVFSMYKPIADDDTFRICALMRLYKIYYRIIGGIIAVVGLIITPAVPLLIKDSIPNGINIYILYLLNLGATVLSYWLFAYKNSILQAHQRDDVASKIRIITSTIQYIVQILILYIFHNYYAYLIVAMIVQVVNNIVTAYVSNMLYPNYKPIGKLPKSEVKQINRRIRDLFTSKIGMVIYDSADTIVISTFLGLSVLAVYQNYFYILSSLTGFITVIFVACTAGIGNSIVVETKEKNYKDLSVFSFIVLWIAGFCSCCLLCLYQPFMELWVGKELMLNFTAVICLVFYFFIRQINSLLNLYKDAAGLWHEDKFRPLVSAMVNLTLNLILVQFIGIYGIVLSTVLAILCVGMPWIIHNLFTIIFEKKKMTPYVSTILYYSFVTTINCFVCYFVCSFVKMGLVATLFVRGIICCFISNLLFFLFYKNKAEFWQSVNLLNNITKGKAQKIIDLLRARSKNS